MLTGITSKFFKLIDMICENEPNVFENEILS